MDRIVTKIKKLREERGLTQVDVANAVGVNYRTIGQYERGVNEPDIATIKKLCDFFDVSADYLLGLKEY